MTIHSKPTHSVRRAQARPSVRGTAILPALMVVMIIATLSMVFVQLSLSKNKEQRVSVDSKRAFYMAEAGLAEGFNGLCLGKSGNVASEDLPAEFGGGLFWTKATEVGSGRVQLESTGLCGAGRATLSLTCERKSDSVGALGFFGGQDITVEPGALIDSFDSRLGTYAMQAATASLALPGARVGGNNDITVQGTIAKPTTIFGDVNPGPLGTLFMPRAGVVITGSRAPSPATVPFSAVKPPMPPGNSSVVLTANRSLTTGALALNKLRVKENVTLALTGPQVIVANEIILDSGARLTIDATNGPVMIYVMQNLEFASGSQVRTASTDPHGVSIHAADQVLIDATGDYHGTIYSPTSTVSLPAGFDIYGSVVANSLTVRTGGKLHFDRALASTDDPNGSPHLLGWHIVELPNVPAVNLRFDALSDLRKQGVTPRKPDQGHFDLGVLPN